MPRPAIKIQPAHRRVLDLLVIAPKQDVWHGREAKDSVNARWIAERCHWSQNTVWMLIREMRHYFKVASTNELVELWRRKNQ